MMSLEKKDQRQISLPANRRNVEIENYDSIGNLFTNFQELLQKITPPQAQFNYIGMKNQFTPQMINNQTTSGINPIQALIWQQFCNNLQHKLASTNPITFESHSPQKDSGSAFNFNCSSILNCSTVSPVESCPEDNTNGGGSTTSSPCSLNAIPSGCHLLFSPSSSKKSRYRDDRGSGKSRKSGFQPGVTVGYTYDAFFVSDGRSKRRKVIGNQRSSTGDESNIINVTTTSSASSDDISEIHSPTGTLPPLSTPAILGLEPEGLGTIKNQRFTCSECGKHYATSSNLSRHKQTHRSLDSKLAKKCPHCGKAYVSMPALSMHILTHDLKHMCDICGKSFSRPWLLQGHRRAHTGEKPYGCAHCGRAFADRSNLRAHMQIHSQAKQYQCNQCGKNFALKSYLNKHLESACSSLDNCENGVLNRTEENNTILPLSIASLVGD